MEGLVVDVLPSALFRRPHDGIEHSVLLFAFHSTFDLDAVRREDVGPEAVEIAAQLVEPVATDGIDAPGSLGFDANQFGRLQHSEVLRHGWSADWAALRELANGSRSLTKRLEDLPAGRISECGQDVSVSHNLR